MFKDKDNNSKVKSPSPMIPKKKAYPKNKKYIKKRSLSVFDLLGGRNLEKDERPIPKFP